MPNMQLAFPNDMGPKFGSPGPPVEEARALMGGLYFDQLCSIIDRETTLDGRGGYQWEEVVRTQVPVHIVKVSNQRGAFTQGSLSAAGHGPLTSAMLWYVYFPMGTGVEIGDIVELASGTRLSIIGEADEANWKVMEAFRATELGLNQ